MVPFYAAAVVPYCSAVDRRVAANPSLIRHQVTRVGPPYLVREMLGQVDETSWNVNLTDGGHIENLGVVELLRRRCRLIIAGDAGADPAHTLKDLETIIEIAKDLFGAIIEIDPAPLRLSKFGRTSAHHLFGTIKYPPLFQGQDGHVGYLLYIKACLTGDESESVSNYAREHSKFPHESTADQFFSTEQFEAYRELGTHTVLNALDGLEGANYATLEEYVRPRILA